MAFTTRFAATAGLFLAFMFVPRPTAAAAHQPAAAQVPATPPVTLKVGSIDLAYIAANSKHGKLATSELETFTRKKQTELEERAKTLGTQEARLKSEGAILAESVRVELERNVRKAQLEFARFREDSESEVQRFAQKVERELRARLFPILDAISKEKGLSLVFTIDSPGLLWFSSTLDVSRDVVERLDQAPQ